MHKRGLVYFKAINLIIIIIASAFYVSLLTVDVRAIKACCEATIAGDYCQYTEEANCDRNVRQLNNLASCEQTSYCQVGCCYNLDNSGCIRSVGKATCEAKSGIFSTDASCNSIQECRQICCVLGNECSLTTTDSCQALASSFGITPDIKDVSSESECLNYCRLDEPGCCSVPGSCSYTKSSECSSIAGSFNPGQYCSSVSSCSTCKARSYKGCIDGQDDVYWFDSCGNPEGKAEECDYASGTSCGEVDGNVQCKSIDCQTTYDSPYLDYDGGYRKNGESWCYYEGSAGGGTDLVGSRHYRHICINGEEIIEPCADYRQEYCIQGKVEVNGEEFNEAFCKPNEGDNCVTTCNTGNIQDDKKCCEQISSCFWSGNNELGSCLPIVPPGSRFWEGDNENICERADQSITVYWEKPSVFSSWKCIGNCQVIKDENFAEKFDSYCAAFSDCGAYYNYEGQFTQDGYSCSRSGGKGCKGEIHDYSFDLVRIDKNYFGDFNKLKKAVGLEFERLTFNDAILANVIDVIRYYILTGVIGVAYALSPRFKEFVEKYGSAVGSVFGAIAIKLFLNAGAAGPGAWALAAAAITFLILSLTSKKDDTTFHLSCNPWQAAPGKQDCSKCDADSLHPCTEYKCSSLGLNCEYIPENEGSSRPTCFYDDTNDGNSPVISPLSYNYEVTQQLSGHRISGLVPANKRLYFGIKTNELAQCKYSDIQGTAFNEMSDYFGSSYYTYEHNVTISPLSGEEYAYYIRCQDKSANANQRDYVLSFSATRGPDLTPPIIEITKPRNNGFVVYNANNVTADLYLNEQSICRWSLSDRQYESMTGSFNCLVNEDPLSALYRCQSILPFTKPSSTYYIRCEDASNNTNSQSYQYTLKGTEELRITSKKPEGKITSKNQTLELTTSGGAESGKSACRFSPGDSVYSIMIDFFYSNSTQHKQILNLDPGTYNYQVKCRDIANNEATAKLAFAVEIDNKPPIIVRMYKDSSSFNMILNEPATCEYSANQFVFGTGINMPNDNSISHSAPLRSSYYIECRDIAGNSFGMVRIFP